MNLTYLILVLAILKGAFLLCAIAELFAALANKGFVLQPDSFHSPLALGVYQSARTQPLSVLHEAVVDPVVHLHNLVVRLRSLGIVPVHRRLNEGSLQLSNKETYMSLGHKLLA